MGLWRKVHAWSSELSALTFAYTKCNGIIGHWTQTNPISCRQSSVFLFFFFFETETTGSGVPASLTSMAFQLSS